MKLKIIVLLLAMSAPVFSQSKKLDSLLNLLNTSRKDTNYIYLCRKISTAYLDEKKNIKLCKQYADSGIIFSKKTKNLRGEGYIYEGLGNAYTQLEDFAKALECFQKSLGVYEKIKFRKGIASTYINMGNMYYYSGSLSKASNAYKKALVICQNEINDEYTSSNLYNNLGIIYANNLKYDSAKTYFLMAKTYYEKSRDSLSIGYSYTNLGMIFFENEQLDSAQTYFNKSLYYKLRFGTNNDKSDAYRNDGNFYFKTKNYAKALASYKTALSFLDTSLYTSDLMENYKALSDVYEKQNNYSLAFPFIKAYLKVMSILQSKEKTAAMVQNELTFDFKKQLFADSLRSANFQEIQKLKISEQQAQIKKDRQQLFFLIFGLFIVLVACVLFYKRYQISQKQKKIINEQKELVDEKQKEIIDSINYAKRIQQAVLTGEDVWNKISKEHFILFKPKDIVSGDFYWAYNTPNNRSVFALADCTGHGVPGGFMSMLGNSFLNEIVVENKIFKANEILNKLRAKIINALEQKGQAEQKDGMDISLCVWNKIDNTLEFAGANNPLWLVRTLSDSNNGVSASRRTGDVELLEYKADKMPIGTYLETELPFTSVTIQLHKGDIIYLSTDGYADQFGGPKGKKFKYKPMIEMLIRNSGESMDVQKAKLETAHNDWKKEHEQVDDVCIIGISV